MRPPHKWALAQVTERFSADHDRIQSGSSLSRVRPKLQKTDRTPAGPSTARIWKSPKRLPVQHRGPLSVTVCGREIRGCGSSDCGGGERRDLRTDLCETRILKEPAASPSSTTQAAGPRRRKGLLGFLSTRRASQRPQTIPAFHQMVKRHSSKTARHSCGVGESKMASVTASDRCQRPHPEAGRIRSGLLQ